MEAAALEATTSEEEVKATRFASLLLIMTLLAVWMAVPKISTIPSGHMVGI